MNRPQFFPLLLGLTITYQHYWVHSARPKPGESVPSETVPNAPVTIQHLFHRWSVWGFLLSVPLGFARFVYIHFTPSQRQNLPTSLFICVDLVFFFFFFFTLWQRGGSCMSGLPIVHYGSCPIPVYKKFRTIFFFFLLWYQGINNKKTGKELKSASCNQYDLMQSRCQNFPAPSCAHHSIGV